MKQAILAISLGGILCATTASAIDGTGHELHSSDLYQNDEIVALGKELHVEYCAACHGENLQGQDDWQTRNINGRTKAPPHDETGHMWHHSDQQNFLITKHGMSEMVGNGYESDMPGFVESLNDGEILAILAYIKSEWPDRVIEKHNQINAGAGH